MVGLLLTTSTGVDKESSFTLTLILISCSLASGFAVLGDADPFYISFSLTRSRSVGGSSSAADIKK